MSQNPKRIRGATGLCSLIVSNRRGNDDGAFTFVEHDVIITAGTVLDDATLANSREKIVYVLGKVAAIVFWERLVDHHVGLE